MKPQRRERIDVDTAIAAAEAPRSAWAVFGNGPFRRVWAATILGLTGIAMSDAASAWLMTSLNADPRAVSLVQVASFLPMFVFTLPAGALVDIIEPRRFLIALETFITAMIVVFAALVSLKLVTPMALLGLTFLLSGAWSVAAPAWAALTPKLVQRRDLDSASAANSVGYNLSRALGPALGGRLILALGVAAPFWGFAIANALSVAVLVGCPTSPRRSRDLPAERLFSAMRAGLRHAAFNPHLRATLMRTLAVFPFGAAFVALLPLVARTQMTAGPEVYGFLIATISIGATLGSVARPYVRRRIGPDGLVAGGTFAIAFGMVLFGICHTLAFAFTAALIAGAGWTSVLTSLSVSAQVALPDWVRGRGLSIYLTVVFGSMAVGSFAWGYVASKIGLPATFLFAAAGAIAGVPLSWSWRLQTAEGMDLSPSLHYKSPPLVHAVDDDSGPVLITLRYVLAGEDPEPFLDAIEEVGRQRRRDGAYAWGVFADVAKRGVYLETFLIGSWLEARHLQARVTNADRAHEEEIRTLLAEAPRLTLMLASDSPKGKAEAHADVNFLHAAQTPV
jgi:predicted MFS family arabinose efflux permease